jgi:glucose-1-phosphate cytidylyltransferase
MSDTRRPRKVVLLAGGVGSRLSEETETKPKPMVEIGQRPILWHIMKHYSVYGFNDFVVCLGYKGEHIKRYFSESLALSSDMTIDFRSGVVETHEAHRDDWRVTLVDTGQHTETGGRLLQVRDFIGDEPFLLTYGDGVADVDLPNLIKFHESHGRLATVTAVHPAARFGRLEMNGDLVTRFDEKPRMMEGWINGGFFVLEPGIFDYIPGDVDWAKAPLEALADAGELAAFRHEGFWQCMDTLRDKIYLNSLWDRGDAPWKTWA